MLKKAIIININHEEATVGLLPDNCTESSSCKECGLCGKNNSNNEIVKLEVKSIPELSNGDIVELEVSSPRDSLIALVIYMLPLFFMFIGGYFGNTLFKNIGMIIGGILGFSLAILIIYILNNSILKIRGRITTKL